MERENRRIGLVEKFGSMIFEYDKSFRFSTTVGESLVKLLLVVKEQD